MKVLLLTLFASFIFSSPIFSGDVSKTGSSGYISLPIPSGYGIKLLNGLGNSGLINSTSSLGFMNPTSIGSLDHLTIGLTYQVNTPIYFSKLNDEINYDRVYNFIPQSLGAVYKYDDFTFGLSMGQEFNSKLDYGEIPVTSAQYPDGTGEYYIPVIEDMIENYSFTAAYNLDNCFFDNACLSLGFRYTLNRFHSYEKLLLVEAEHSTFASSIEAGILLKFEELQLGLSFNSGKIFSYQVEEQTLTNIGSPYGTYHIGGYEVQTKLPPILNFDALFNINDFLQLTSSVNNAFWNSSYTRFTNQFDISSNLIFKPTGKIIGSCGLLLSNYSISDDYENENNAVFILLGLKLKFENFNMDFALADSHLLSGDYRKQAIAKLGLEVQL